MTKLRSAALSMLFAGLATNPVAAQDSGFAGFIDWLHKLSGPQLGGFGVAWYRGLSADDGLRLRVSASFLWSYDEAEEIDPDDAGVSMIAVSPSLEYPLGFASLEASAGVSLNRFGGDADGFFNVSFPLMLQARPRLGSTLFLRFGAGAMIFPAFDENDFEPLIVDVSRDGAEAVFRIILGLDWQR